MSHGVILSILVHNKSSVYTQIGFSSWVSKEWTFSQLVCCGCLLFIACMLNVFFMSFFSSNWFSLVHVFPSFLKILHGLNIRMRKGNENKTMELNHKSIVMNYYRIQANTHCSTLLNICLCISQVRSA